MDIEVPLEDVPTVAKPEVRAKNSLRPATAWTIALFVVFWLAFYALDSGLPYLTDGSDIINRAKVKMEEHQQIFPVDRSVTRVMIFGDSKVLAGFMPSEFDRMARASGLKVSSFNSGFPGTAVFLPELKAVAENGQAPNVLLLTLPWMDPPHDSFFHLVRNDHKVIHALFPFRFWLRNATDFMMNARRYGGILAGYRQARRNQELVQADRGYYLILEQSHFPNGRLPDNFRLPTDHPDKVDPRVAPPVSSQTRELDRLIARYRMHCFYVPQYTRIGESAPPPPVDTAFAAAIARDTPCSVLGPAYFLYPNRDFSDQTHTNGDGARIYTADIFHLVEAELQRVQDGRNAVQ